MSNILIIKHGSLGDISQACGAIQDISENHKEDEIHLLTTKPYLKKMKFICLQPNHTLIYLKKIHTFLMLF